MALIGSLAGAAGKLALHSAATSLTFGAAAASVALAGAYATNRVYHNTLGRNGTFRTHQARIPGTQIDIPWGPKFTRTFQNTFAGGGLIGGLGMGAMDQVNSKRWSLEQSLATGAVEIERPSFMGASGSLVLASRKRRSGMPANHEGILNSHNLHAIHMLDDVAAVAF